MSVEKRPMRSVCCWAPVCLNPLNLFNLERTTPKAFVRTLALADPAGARASRLGVFSDWFASRQTLWCPQRALSDPKHRPQFWQKT